MEAVEEKLNAIGCDLVRTEDGRYRIYDRTLQMDISTGADALTETEVKRLADARYRHETEWKRQHTA